MLILFALLQAAAPTPAPTPPAPPPAVPPAVPPAAPAAAPAPWAVQTRTDAASGTTSVLIATLATDRDARLMVRCDRVAEPVVSVQFGMRQPLTAADEHAVSVAFDGGAPLAGPWIFPGKAAYTNETGLVTRLTTALATARVVTVTTTDAGSPVTASFAGPGSDAGIRQVLEACGYTLGKAPAPLAPPKK